MTAAIQKCGKGNADEAIGLKRFPGDSPGRPQLYDEPIAVHPYVGIRGNVDLDLGARAVADPKGDVDQAGLLDKPQPLLRSVAIDLGPGAQIVVPCFENHGSCQWICSTPPEPYRARQTCVGCHIGSER